MLKNIYKYIVIIIIIVILAITFTSSHRIQSIDDLAYTVALGIDVGEKENLKVTFQFTMPSANSESGSAEAAPPVIDTVEADSIDSAINLMNAYVSKELNLSHCKVIIISEEFAKNGIGKEIYSLMNKVQIRPDNNVIISTSTAKEYIESALPSLENLAAKFYEVLPRSSEYTGYSTNAQLGEFFNQLVCKTCEPTAILGNVLSKKETPNSSSEGTSSDSNQSELKSAKNGIENLGVAVFKEDKLIGKLTKEETLIHLLVRDNLKSCNISIPDPDDNNKKIDLYLTRNYSPKIKVSFVNGTPYIKINIIVNGKISSISNISQEMTEKKFEKIEQSAEAYIKKLLYNYLYKTSKEFRSDIAGFGKYALNQFKTNNEFEEYNWLNHYQDAFFEVNTKVNVKSSFLLTGA